MVVAIPTGAFGLALLGACASFMSGGGTWSIFDLIGDGGRNRKYSSAGKPSSDGDSTEQNQDFMSSAHDDDGHQRGAFMPVSVVCSCPPVDCSCTCVDTPRAIDPEKPWDFNWMSLIREPSFLFSWLSWGLACGLFPRCLAAACQRRAAPPPALFESDLCRYATQMPSPSRGRPALVREIRRRGHVE